MECWNVYVLVVSVPGGVMVSSARFEQPKSANFTTSPWTREKPTSTS